MKLVYEILYKNGKEDKVSVKANEENSQLLHEVNKTFEDAMREEISAVVTLGDGETSGHYIRVSDVSRVKINVEESK